ncbi:putative MFS family arabinose efflux permease [Asanoa ferruginea]|uniref:Putative MFS family arabinose efflux permease n=1 Tax=Asanoa ferruginea TaxID=53367 RepID=A0A3D9ZYQ8_9ACTN|nr:MFS transporter [Asanoa ferruginea]REG02298.1 putative MFS family arabinose efflux permease [Asanoa ferruginea]GIF46535.1 MFS transporter [Asanoa ferruginea]
MSTPTRAASYRAVLTTPHALRTFSAALVGRLSYGVVFVSLMVALTSATGSYSLAGAAIALFGAGAVLVAPLRAGLIDRHGPRLSLPPMAIAYAALLAALAFATWRPGAAPGWVLLLLTASAGVCSPPLGPVMRTLWSNLLPDPARRQRAFALDTVVEELLYVTGPVLAGLFIAIGRPALGVATSAVLVLVGTLAMVSSPAARAWPAPPAVAPPLRGGRALWEPVIVVGGLGLALGSLGLLIVAFAVRHDQLTAVAWVEAALAAGSAIGGIAYGARTWALSQRTQLPLLTLALAAVLVTAGFAPGVVALAAAAALAGLFVAPALTTAYLLVDGAVPAAARTRAGTWVNSAFNAGSSGGTAAIGLLIGRAPLPVCFAVAALPLLLTAAGVLVPSGRRVTAL